MIVLSIHASYKGQFSQQHEKLAYRTIELSDFYNGSNKWLGLLGNLVDGLRLIFYSMWLPHHQLVVLTDPSLINAWAIYPTFAVGASTQELISTEIQEDTVGNKKLVFSQFVAYNFKRICCRILIMSGVLSIRTYVRSINK